RRPASPTATPPCFGFAAPSSARTENTRTPGFLEPAELVRWLSATDVFLAPFTDGVSTRRTTVMAALQQSLAVVGTDGFLTDDILRNATNAMRLVPAGDSDSFVNAVVELSKRPESRVALGGAGSALYRAEFDWPVAARRVLSVLGITPHEQ
ncbi:MAG TPA: glycosyltransferase, partial [Gaiellaceae bacterium]|nr:glycosyltransferase [Gaiellaceae bacterium]